MTSYQKSIHNYSNFKVLEDKGTFGSPFVQRAAARKKKTEAPTQKTKIYCVTGTAPAPSKDFFELTVNIDDVIFRKWRIKFSKNGKCGAPSEDRMNHERFLDSDVIQGEVERSLGGDALHMAVGHITKNWLPRLPINVLTNITSYLNLFDIARLHQVNPIFNKRLQQDEVWNELLSLHFDVMVDENLRAKNPRKTLKWIYKQEVIKKRENEIDWDNV